MAGAPPTHHLLRLSLPSGQTLHGHCATPHQTIGLGTLGHLVSCVCVIRIFSPNRIDVAFIILFEIVVGILIMF